MKKKKQSLTLLEIMIVIFLIGIIGSVIGYNMKGSLEKGKVFKTERAIEQVTDILSLEIAQGANPKEVVDHAVEFLKKSRIVKKPESLIIDGWGTPLNVQFENGEIVVTSANLEKFKAK